MKKRTQTSVSMNKFSTEVVSRLACRAINSEYSRCSSDFKFDKRGTSIGEPRSTRRVQSPSHARLLLALVRSPSRGGFDKLRSSFPILSACLWKNRCSTIASVSSDVMPSQWSLLSSMVAKKFYFVSVKKYQSHRRVNYTHASRRGNGSYLQYCFPGTYSKSSCEPL
jgi:hypothetical protein